MNVDGFRDEGPNEVSDTVCRWSIGGKFAGEPDGDEFTHACRLIEQFDEGNDIFGVLHVDTVSECTCIYKDERSRRKDVVHEQCACGESPLCGIIDNGCDG